MKEVTLGSKNQVTVPKAVREAMGLHVGDKIWFVPARSGFRLAVVRHDPNSLAGMFKDRRKKALSIKAMNAAIAEMGSRAEPAD